MTRCNSIPRDDNVQVNKRRGAQRACLPSDGLVSLEKLSRRELFANDSRLPFQARWGRNANWGSFRIRPANYSFKRIPASSRLVIFEVTAVAKINRNLRDREKEEEEEGRFSSNFRGRIKRAVVVKWKSRIVIAGPGANDEWYLSSRALVLPWLRACVPAY